MQKAAIIINAYLRPKNVIRQAGRLKEEFEKRGVSADIIQNNSFLCHLEEDGEVSVKLAGYDFVVYLDKDKYTARLLEKAGFCLFNRYDAIEKCDDKMTTAIFLAGSGIPVPKTLPGLLSYSEEDEISEKSLKIVEEELGYPIIIKGSYGSMGREVDKADNFEELFRAAKKFQLKPHLFQRFVSESSGRDIRVAVIGGKAIRAMERRSDIDYRSNIGLGAEGVPFDPPAEVVEIAEKAAVILGLDYCGADILFGRHGYYLTEVNSNAFFEGMEKVTGCNIAAEYVDHILSEVGKGR